MIKIIAKFSLISLCYLTLAPNLMASDLPIDRNGQFVFDEIARYDEIIECMEKNLYIIEKLILHYNVTSQESLMLVISPNDKEKYENVLKFSTSFYRSSIDYYAACRDTFTGIPANAPANNGDIEEYLEKLKLENPFVKMAIY